MTDILLTYDFSAFFAAQSYNPYVPYTVTPFVGHGQLTLDLTSQSFVSSTVAFTQTSGFGIYAPGGSNYVFSQLSRPVQFVNGFEIPWEPPLAGIAFYFYDPVDQITLVTSGLGGYDGGTLGWAQLDRVLTGDKNFLSVPEGSGRINSLSFTPEPLVTVATPEPTAWLAMAAALVAAAGWRKLRALLA